MDIDKNLEFKTYHKALVIFGVQCYTGPEVSTVKENIWKILSSIELGAALLFFFAGIGYMGRYGLESGGQFLLLGVGFLNAALLTVIIDKLSSMDGGKKD